MTGEAAGSERFAVTGGRDFAGYALVVHALRQIPETWTLVHGAATGADMLAAEFWGDVHDRPTEAHPADWAEHGKAAGPLRNQEMVDSGIGLLIAFPDGRGTADMVRRSVAAGVKLIDLRAYGSRDGAA